jgi:catechol 2,3-dioxygenase-like lactoylglutathione lyase family enzyme
MEPGRVLLYAKDVEQMVAFYEKYFGFRALRQEGDRIVELIGADGGASLTIHLAGKRPKSVSRW